MITDTEAKLLAIKKIDELGEEAKISLSVLEDETISFDYGWMFFYQSEEYLSTGNPGKMVGGNAPIIVDRYNASVHITGTGQAEDYYIKKYSQLRNTPERFRKEIT